MKKTLAILFTCLALTACNPDGDKVVQPAPVVQQVAPQAQAVQPQQQQPVIIEQAAAPQSDPNSGLLTGMILGHMMSGGSNRTTVVHHTTVVRPSYRSAPSRSYSRSRRR